MARVGLVLGGGGITGAAFHFGTLLSIRMATGWDPGDAEVVVGTSSGAVVTALVRSNRLSLDAMIGDVHGSAELAWELRRRIYRRTRPQGVGRWMRHGLLPGLRHPGVGLAVGSPARYTTDGIADWIRETLGDAAERWPAAATTVVAYEVETRRRVAFGTEGSPDVSLADAVAASSAVPLVFEPVLLDGMHYVDGGVASGTNLDLVLGHPEPLDLVIVIAPMASVESHPDAPFYAAFVDNLGGAALNAELKVLERAWPDTDILVLRPDQSVLAAGRSNPLDPAAALPTFLATLRSMRSALAAPDVWPVLERHFPDANASYGGGASGLRPSRPSTVNRQPNEAFHGCRSGGVDPDRVVSGGAVGTRWNSVCGLGRSRAVGGPDRDRVVARRQLYRGLPLHPRPRRERFGESTRRPIATVHGDLDLRDTLERCPGDAGDLDLPGSNRAPGAGKVDPGLRLDRRLLGPTPRDPIRIEPVPGGQLDLRQPLGGRHIPVEAGHDQPLGIRVPLATGRHSSRLR